MKQPPNVNVSLASQDFFTGKKFPCPVCGSSVSIRIAKTRKPYFHCDSCGLQTFIRGKKGIERFKKLVQTQVLISGLSDATVLYNRLEQLKEQKKAYEERQGLLFRDRDLDRLIEALDAEIDAVRAELDKVGTPARRDKR